MASGVAAATKRADQLDRRVIAVLTLPALVAAAVAAGLGGAVAAYAIGDPGAVVRWSVPLVRAVRDVAAATTIGVLLVAAFLMPETMRTRRRVTAARLASSSALVWLVTLVIQVITDFADASGLAPTQGQYWNQLSGLVWEIAATRMVVISAIIVGAVALGSARAEGKPALAWCWFGALFALMPIALSGHSAVSRDHMSSINAFAVHIVAATIWVGGLLALVIMRSMIGPHLGVTVARYSTVATWSYAALALSGVLAAWFNLSALGDFASAYGAMLLVKAGALLALGVAGWRQRQHIVAALDSDPSSRSAFARLAVAELALMGVALGTAVALARTPAPAAERISPDPTSVYALTGYPDPGPPPSNVWVSTWHTDWLWLVLALLACGVYLRWVVRLRRRGDHWPLWQLLCWVLGWALFVYTTSGAPGVYGRIMFSWHMTMHMSVAMIVPLLLVPAAPITLALRALPARRDKTMGPREFVLGLVHSRYLQIVANPVVAAVIFFFSLATFYFTPLFSLALSTHTGHVLMVAHFLLSGYLFAWVLVGTDPGPKRWPPLMLLMVLFATISFHAFLGVVITGSNNLMAADFFNRLGIGWLPDPLDDQHRGGAIAWGIGEAPTLVLAMMVALQWVRADDRETHRLDRQADRDDDAELVAYNAQLARLAEQDARMERRR